ncbi:hypothetical protein LshimejAT787_0403360 [Lyophyllum shimeji]|uniref:BZIP domain-containing protein n=1 Tax=Lyophyllum shimeji TaxID=47721 RepID=A0A9P3UMZ2_LYOSH|nr:hypothetical protein LshimejAT787_0403360 [Lyophyllum shimeji]
MWERASPFLAQFMPIVISSPSSGEQNPVQPFSPQPPPIPAILTRCARVPRMTRGRKKDLTIPPTRALIQQRDYRARRAQYVADLEERVRKAEEENAQLRNELAAARAGQAIPPLALDAQTAHASSELLHSLAGSQPQDHPITLSLSAQITQLMFSDLPRSPLPPRRPLALIPCLAHRPVTPITHLEGSDFSERILQNPLSALHMT